MFLLKLLNLNEQFQKTFTYNTHSWPVFKIPKYQEQGALKKKKPVWYDSFLEESNVWEITNYKMCSKKYLTWQYAKIHKIL